MQIITEPHTLQQTCLRWRADNVRITLVPTMGCYHAGHESVIRKARDISDKVVVSLFVNPKQYAPDEAPANHPRDLERDAALAREAGADVLFVPRARDMYADDFATWVDVPLLSNPLDGKDNHLQFRGLATVVTKLLMLSQAVNAVFGKKDWQQMAVLRHMVRDLNIPVELVACDTVREPDGLALSSRNNQLSTEERAQAPHIYQGLTLARSLARQGEADPAAIAAAVHEYWKSNLPLGSVDYFTIINPMTLARPARINDANGPVLAACAVRLGKTRLIDNIMLINKAEAPATRHGFDPMF